MEKYLERIKERYPDSCLQRGLFTNNWSIQIINDNKLLFKAVGSEEEVLKQLGEFVENL